jgi:6-phosphofructokinase 1
LKEEGATLFDSRSAALGHTLQGGVPSPTDRARAVRLAMKCMSFIETQAAALKAQPEKSRKATGDSAAVITIQGSSITMTPVQEIVKHADMKNRRGINPWWEGLKDLAEVLGGRKDLARV